jgi:hypothetical protein
MKNRRRSRFQPTFSALEDRAVPAVTDPVGTFAVIDGKLSPTNQATAPRVNFDFSLFRFTRKQVVSVKVQATASDGGDLLMGPAVNNVNPNPRPSPRPRLIPSVVQFPAGRNAQIVNFRPGSYTFPVTGGWTNRQATYHLSFQLVGDINGDSTVNRTDIRMLTDIMRNPAKYGQQIVNSADYDGSGKVDPKDLRLANLNLLAAAYLRPLDFATQINTAATPIVNGYTRDSSASILVGGSPMASFVATNLSVPTTGEVGGSLSNTGNGVTTVPLQIGQNVLAVTLHDGFGQSLSTNLNVLRLPRAVVVIPDVGGSVPKDPSQAAIDSFYNTRGVAASSLTVSTEYYAMINSLIATGYSLNRDLFLATYDWRLSQAPTDSSSDGNLSNLTASSMIQANNPYQVGYLGNLMAAMVANDATIKSVDLVAIGGGAILARSYVQSPALGGSFTNTTGASLKLPTVDNLMMVSAPNDGIPQFFNTWTNDFNGAFGGNTATVMENLNDLFTAVSAGTLTIPGPDYTIDKTAITDPSTGQPSPLIFARLYFPSFRQNIADYDFLSINGQLTNVNAVPDASPQLLLDLNAASKPGNNPWLTRVTIPFVTAGVTTSTIAQLFQQTGTGGTIWPIGQPAPIATVDGQTWYQPAQTINEGDGMVPLTSLLSTFANDPRISLKFWGSADVTPPSGITFTPTTYNTTHLGLLSNPDFLLWLRKQLLT